MWETRSLKGLCWPKWRKPSHILILKMIARQLDDEPAKCGALHSRAIPQTLNPLRLLNPEHSARATISKGSKMETPNREPQEYSRNIIGI